MANYRHVPVRHTISALSIQKYPGAARVRGNFFSGTPLCATQFEEATIRNTDGGFFYGLNCVAHRDAKAVKSCYNSISAFGIVSCTGTQTDTDRKNPLPLHPVQAKLQIQLQMRFHESFRFVCVMSGDGIVDFLMLFDQ